MKLSVVYGHRYQGSADVPWALEFLVTHDRALEGIAARGFVDTAVWTDSDKLPSNWPRDHAEGDLFARATWGGRTGEIELPDAVKWVQDMGPVPMPVLGSPEEAKTLATVKREVTGSKASAIAAAQAKAEKRATVMQTVIIASGLVSIVVGVTTLLRARKP